MKKALALLLSFILTGSLCACSGGKTAESGRENEAPASEQAGMIVFTPADTGEGRITGALICSLTNGDGTETIGLHMQSVCETLPDGSRTVGDGKLFFLGLEAYVEQAQIPSFVYGADASVTVRYDPSVSLSHEISVYRYSEEGLQKLDGAGELRPPEPGKYLFDIRLHVSRGEDYYICDALFWMIRP